MITNSLLQPGRMELCKESMCLVQLCKKSVGLVKLSKPGKYTSDQKIALNTSILDNVEAAWLLKSNLILATCSYSHLF